MTRGHTGHDRGRHGRQNGQDRQARHDHHDRLRDRLRDDQDDRSGADDRATLGALLDPEAEAGILRRPDAFLLTATTVHTAVRG